MSALETIEYELGEITKKVAIDRGKQEVLLSQLQNSKKDLKRKGFHLEAVTEARAIFQKAAQDTQAKLEEHIGNLVTKALGVVFEDPYEFKLEFVQKRGKTEADLWFVRHDQKCNPVDASGGGAVDIASFALRIAYWSLTKKTRPIFLLDEPFKHLSADLQGLASDMLTMLAKQLKVQIIMVSHIKPLIEGADNIIKLGIDGSLTKQIN
jgi:DNA repair exonuclease SbcCD ATPase subunit